MGEVITYAAYTFSTVCHAGRNRLELLLIYLCYIWIKVGVITYILYTHIFHLLSCVIIFVSFGYFSLFLLYWKNKKNNWFFSIFLIFFQIFVNFSHDNNIIIFQSSIIIIDLKLNFCLFRKRLKYYRLFKKS